MACIREAQRGEQYLRRASSCKDVEYLRTFMSSIFSSPIFLFASVEVEWNKKMGDKKMGRMQSGMRAISEPSSLRNILLP